MKIITGAAVVVLLTILCFYTVTEGRTLRRKKVLNPRPPLPFCSRRCNGGESRRGANELFPPYRCSCSRSCAVFGDCCYDSPHRGAELWQQYEFVCVSVMGRSGYQAVSNCPPGLFTHNSQNCERNLGLLPPVTSSRTNITYANLYCAQCNGDSNHLTVWNVDLSCPSSTDYPTPGRYDRTEYNSNDFWTKKAMLLQSKKPCKFGVRGGDFRIIDRLEVRPCVTVNKISKCSPSWKDMAFAKKCASYEDPVFLDNTAFRNPHCAHCNYVNLSYVECVPSHLKNTLRKSRIFRDDVIRYCTAHQCHLDLGNGRAYTVSRVFNVFYSEKSCPGVERYDPYTCRCRSVVKRRRNLFVIGS